MYWNCSFLYLTHPRREAEWNSFFHLSSKTFTLEIAFPGLSLLPAANSVPIPLYQNAIKGLYPLNKYDLETPLLCSDLWPLLQRIYSKEKFCEPPRILYNFTYVSAVIEIAICPSTFYINALKFLRWYSMFHPLLWQMEETFGVVKCLYEEQSLLMLSFYLKLI